MLKILRGFVGVGTVSWILLTLAVMILVSLSQMFAREDTLDSVREVDFRIVYSVTTENGGEPVNNFKKSAGEIKIYSGYVLFPMALLLNANCVGNGRGSDSNSLCRIFTSYSDWEKKKSSSPLKMLERGFFKYSGDTFIFKKIGSRGVLIGKAGAYSSANPYASPYKTFAEQAARYYLTSQSGLIKVFEKTKGSLFLVFSLSVVLGVAVLIKNSFHDRKLSNLEVELSELNRTIIQYENRVREAQNALRNKSFEVELLESQLGAKEGEAEIVKGLLARARREKEEIELDYLMASENLENKEAENEVLRSKILLQTKKIDRDDLNERFNRLEAQYNRICDLWKSNPKWARRVRTERDANPASSNIPFTLGLSFIAFEKHVNEWFESLTEGEPKPAINPSLEHKIETIEKKCWSGGGSFARDRSKEFQKYTRIRIARNNWFHEGRAPQEAIIQDLIDVIKDQPAQL